MERVTLEQKTTLLDFLEGYPELLTGKFVGPAGRQKLNSLWEELAGQLNEQGVRKSAEKWKKVWIDIKSRTKKYIYTMIRTHASGTGGGSPSNIHLTDIEARVLGVLVPETIEGNNDPILPMESSVPAEIDV